MFVVVFLEGREIDGGIVGGGRRGGRGKGGSGRSGGIGRRLRRIDYGDDTPTVRNIGHDCSSSARRKTLIWEEAGEREREEEERRAPSSRDQGRESKKGLVR